MFLVLNKEKISAYIVSILTVCLLFFIASNNTAKENVTSTSSNVEKSIKNNIINTTNSLNDINNILKMNNAVN